MKSKYLFIPAFLSVIVGCNPYITYRESLPPRIATAPGETRILFISQFDTASFDYNQKKKVSTFKRGYSKLIDGVQAGFKDTDIDITWQDTINSVLSPAGNSLNKETVTSLATQHSSDMILSLESFEMDRNKAVDIEENDDGSKTRTAYFTVEAQVDMTLYSKEGEVIDKYLLIDEKPIDKREVLSGLLAIGPALGNQQKVIYPMLKNLGKTYAENFKNQSVSHYVKYYGKGIFKPLKPLVKAENWKEASLFLLNIYHENADEKIKTQAAHNLYHISMAANDIESAQKWRSFVK